jgi:hypothetical protein
MVLSSESGRSIESSLNLASSQAACAWPAGVDQVTDAGVVRLVIDMPALPASGIEKSRYDRPADSVLSAGSGSGAKFPIKIAPLRLIFATPKCVDFNERAR